MNSINSGLRLVRMTFIVAHDQGDKILRKARQLGCSGAIVKKGKGTRRRGILDNLGLTDQNKDIVTILADGSKGVEIFHQVTEFFQMEKPNHGIAFVRPVEASYGSRGLRCTNDESKRSDSMEYVLITVIVDKGNAEDVVTSAEAGGAKGGTIMNAKGAGIHETQKLFNMDVHPEKEMVLILVREEESQNVIDHIRRDLNLDEPGNGILFVEKIIQAFGMV